MKKLTCTIFCATLALTLARAEETPAAQTGETPALEAKNKSSFTDEGTRNPFWPIGWKPAIKKQGNSNGETAGPEIRESAFRVSAITMDAKNRFAIINGKVMDEGTVFGLQMGGQTYQITVKAIQDGQVILQRRDQEIVVPLSRR